MQKIDIVYEQILISCQYISVENKPDKVEMPALYLTTKVFVKTINVQ